MKKKKTKPVKVCSDCIHEYACQAWNIGNIHSMDASYCDNYETVRDSVAYFIGYREGQRKIFETGGK